MALQIRAGSTRHPLSTFTSEEPPAAPPDAEFVEQAAIVIDKNRIKTSKRCILKIPL
jgi:hypothetical protein